MLRNNSGQKPRSDLHSVQIVNTIPTIIVVGESSRVGIRVRTKKVTAKGLKQNVPKDAIAPSETLKPVNTKAKATRGRPLKLEAPAEPYVPPFLSDKLQVTPEFLKKVADVAGHGLTVPQTAAYFGISIGDWLTYCKESPAIDKAMQMGKAHQIYLCASKLLEHVEKGSLSATMFYLRTQANFNELAGSKLEGLPSPEDSSKLPELVKDPIEASKIYQQIMTGT